MSSNSNERVSVYILTPYYPPSYSGASLQAKRINRLLLGYNVNIKVITRKFGNETQLVEGIHVLRVSPFLWAGQKIGLLLWSVLVSLHLIKERRNIDVLHVLENYSIASIFTIVSVLLNKPIIVKNSIARGAMQNDTIKQKTRLFILKKWAYIIVISGETYNEVLKIDYPKEKIIFIPNGVDISTFHPDYKNKKQIREKLAIEKDIFLITYVGILNERKGITLLINSWNEVLLLRPNSRLLLIGPFDDANYKKKVLEIVNYRKLKNKITILDYKHNINHYLQASDAFIFLSDREGLPNALMEAMACGLPSIARPIGGVNDLVDNNYNGLVCNGEGKELIENTKEAIVNLIDDIELRFFLGENARKTIINRYSIDKISDKYLSVYRSLSKNKRYTQHAMRF